MNAEKTLGKVKKLANEAQGNCRYIEPCEITELLEAKPEAYIISDEMPEIYTIYMFGDGTEYHFMGYRGGYLRFWVCVPEENRTQDISISLSTWNTATCFAKSVVKIIYPKKPKMQLRVDTDYCGRSSIVMCSSLDGCLVGTYASNSGETTMLLMKRVLESAGIEVEVLK